MAADPRIFIRQRAAELGFGVCRFASASEPWSAGEKLAHFVEAGRHGDMAWLASPKHRASLLSKGFQRLGAGLGVDPKGPACGDFYLVQNFAD